MKNLRVYLIIFCIPLISVNINSQQWIKTPLSGGDDKVMASVTDIRGNIYVTGYVTQTVGGINYRTQKYKPSGELVWTAIYNGDAHGEDKAFGISVDMLGNNVYVTGYSASIGNNIDIATLKYRASDGSQLAIYRFGDPSNLEDKAFGITVDRIGNVYITGYITRPFIGNDIYIAKYNSNLNFVWHNTFEGTGNGEDRSFGIVTDSLGLNIFIAGSVTDSAGGLDMITICYDSSGTRKWYDTYPGAEAELEDRAFGISIDNYDGGSVYVTGFVTDSINNSNYMTIKYYPSTGDTVWTRRYNGSGNGLDKAFGITVDNLGSCYITGMSTGMETGGDYVTIKYNREGDQVWAKRYYGPGGFKDSATGIVYSKEFIYVTGFSIADTSSGKEDVFTIKYNMDNGDSVQASRVDFNDLKDVGVKVVADTEGNVYIAGYTYSAGNDFDWFLMKYYEGELVIGIQQISANVPEGFALYQNYPNPFNPVTRIKFDIPSVAAQNNEPVKLVIYDILGRETAVLVNKQLTPGTYEVDWDASKLASGIYFYQLTVAGFNGTRKLMLIK